MNTNSLARALRLPAVVATLFAIALAHAAPADPDLTFGTAGTIAFENVVSPFARWSQHSAVLQPDGKLLVVAGTAQPSGIPAYPSKVSWQLRRYTTGGLPDATFGVGGSRIVSFDLDYGGYFGDDYPNAVAVLPDGRFVVAGHSLSSQSQCSFGCGSTALLARFNPDGSFDASFGSGGKATSTTILGADALAIQSDGKMVVSGNQSVPRASIAFMQVDRFNVDGTRDTGYVSSIACDGNGTLRPAPDGKMLIGTALPSGDFCIARLNADGSRDVSFGTQGRTVIKGDANSVFGDFYVDAAGAVTGIGWATTGLVFRLTSDGAPDSTFGVAGIVTYDARRAAGTLAGDCSARTVVATQASVNTTGPFSTARFAPGGALDLAFAGNASGFFSTGIGGGQTPFQLLQKADGRIIALSLAKPVLNVFQYQGDAPCGGATGGTVVEFHNANLDNYFITANAGEAAAIDSGSAGPGWSRTGHTFKSGGKTAVCRFYGSLSPGPNSHFYTLSGPECNSLRQLQSSTPGTEKRWNFESLDFVSTPTYGDKSCPAGTLPVYRAYNDGYARGVDSNHRITTSQSEILTLVTHGWRNEGVVMCAPQ